MNNYKYLWLVTEQWEIFYYIAFIVLTLIIAAYTIKTYLLQSRKKSELLCKCSESDGGKGNGRVLLEIYNHGNAVAKDICITIQKLSFGSIPFLKPRESYFIPIGHSINTGDHKTVISFTDGINLSSSQLEVELAFCTGETQMFSIDMSLLKNVASNPEPDVKELSNISTELKNINKGLSEIQKHLKK